MGDLAEVAGSAPAPAGHRHIGTARRHSCLLIRVCPRPGNSCRPRLLLNARWALQASAGHLWLPTMREALAAWLNRLADDARDGRLHVQPRKRLVLHATTLTSLSAWQRQAGAEVPLQPLLQRVLEANTAPADGAEASSRASPPPGGSGSGSGGGGRRDALRVELPCALRPAVGPKGLDVQLRLLQLTIGDPGGSGSSSSTRGSSSSGSAACDSGTAGSLTLVSLRRTRPAPAPRQQQPALVAVLDKAAGLLAARLLFPDAAGPLLRLLAAAHCAIAAVQASGLLLPPAARAAARRRLRSRRPLDAAARCVSQLGAAVRRHGEPAFVLLAAALLWAKLSPTRAQMGERIAGALLT